VLYLELLNLLISNFNDFFHLVFGFSMVQDGIFQEMVLFQDVREHLGMQVKELLVSLPSTSEASRGLRTESVGLYQYLVDKEHRSPQGLFACASIFCAVDPSKHQLKESSFLFPQFLD
jgi:hypothetical protein